MSQQVDKSNVDVAGANISTPTHVNTMSDNTKPAVNKLGGSAHASAVNAVSVSGQNTSAASDALAASSAQAVSHATRLGHEYVVGDKTHAGSSTVEHYQRRRRSRYVPRARRMKFSIVHFNPTSVAKVAFLLSTAAGIIQVICAALIWIVLNSVGVFNHITQIVSSTGLDASGFSLSDVFSLSTVLSAVTIFSVIQIILCTILCTIAAWLYNVVSQMVGGVQVTLGDD